MTEETRRSHEKLDPEIKALRAIGREVLTLDPEAKRRITNWLRARVEADEEREEEQAEAAE